MLVMISGSFEECVYIKSVKMKSFPLEFFLFKRVVSLPTLLWKCGIHLNTPQRARARERRRENNHPYMFGIKARSRETTDFSPRMWWKWQLIQKKPHMKHSLQSAQAAVRYHLDPAARQNAVSIHRSILVSPRTHNLSNYLWDQQTHFSNSNREHSSLGTGVCSWSAVQTLSPLWPSNLKGRTKMQSSGFQLPDWASVLEPVSRLFNRLLSNVKNCKMLSATLCARTSLHVAQWKQLVGL